MSELSEAILRLKSEGKSYNQIRDQLGCSKGTIAYYLGAGQKEKNLNRQRDRRAYVRRYIQQLKQESICSDCGENYPYWIMQFDHLPNFDKSFNISSNISPMNLSLDKVKEEIAKCEVVCANCHANRTHLRKLTGTPNSDTLDLTEYYGDKEIVLKTTGGL